MPIVYIVTLAAIYASLYYFNHKTPAPKGLENLKANCDSCKISNCGNNPVHNYKEEI